MQAYAVLMLVAASIAVVAGVQDRTSAYPWIPTFPDSTAKFPAQDESNPPRRTQLLAESANEFGIDSNGAGVKIIRAPKFDHEVRMFDQDRECSAIYEVELDPVWTTQGNDIGMLPPHGKNMAEVLEGNVNFKDKIAQLQAKATWAKDWTKYPYPNDATKQAQAAAQYKPTALSEPRATPLGFKQDVMRYGHEICIRVKNVGRRWVEIMAQSSLPDQQICVSDWKKEHLGENPVQETCGNGALVMCRDSALEYPDTRDTSGRPSSSSPDQLLAGEDMTLKLFCKDSCDFDDMEIFWRITASNEEPKCQRFDNAGKCVEYTQPDAENWCMMREGDDFPSSLLQPYPENYVPPPVFELRSAGSAVVASVWLAALACILALVF